MGSKQPTRSGPAGPSRAVRLLNDCKVERPAREAIRHRLAGMDRRPLWLGAPSRPLSKGAGSCTASWAEAILRSSSTLACLSQPISGCSWCRRARAAALIRTIQSRRNSRLRLRRSRYCVAPGALDGHHRRPIETPARADEALGRLHDLVASATRLESAFCSRHRYRSYELRTAADGALTCSSSARHIDRLAQLALTLGRSSWSGCDFDRRV